MAGAPVKTEGRRGPQMSPLRSVHTTFYISSHITESSGTGALEHSAGEFLTRVVVCERPQSFTLSIKTRPRTASPLPPPPLSSRTASLLHSL